MSAATTDSLFNYPLLSLFGRHTQILDIPPVFAYVFFAWAAVIAVMA